MSTKFLGKTIRIQASRSSNFDKCQKFSIEEKTITFNDYYLQEAKKSPFFLLSLL